MDFRVLGPLEVWDRGSPVQLGRGKERALLAVLLLHSGEVVSTDRLIEALWGEASPSTAVKSVQVYVSHLRKLLGAEAITTGPGGYAVDLEPGTLDLHRFELLVDRARDTSPAVAAELLREGLELWRGPPLEELAYEPFAGTQIARLVEMRLAAVEDRIEAELALGRHAALVPELESLVETHRFRERLRAQLMLALYRSGRQAEALSNYREARAVLHEELGLEPGPELQRLERRILNHDPDLEPGPAPRRQPDRSQGRWRRRRAGAAALALAVAALLIAALLREGDSAFSSGVVVVEAGAGVVDRITVGSTPSTVVVGDDGVWVVNADDSTVSRLDPATGAIERTFATGSIPTDLALGASALWAGNGVGSTESQLVGNVYAEGVSRIDPQTAVVAGTTRFPPAAAGDGGYRIVGANVIAAARSGVWAIAPDLTVWRIDPVTGELDSRVEGIDAAIAVTVGDGALWVTTQPATVVRVEPSTNRVTARIRLPASDLAGLAAGAGSVWVAGPQDGIVWRIDPGRQAVARTISLEPGVTGVAFADGAVWVVNPLEGTLSRIDPRTSVLAEKVELEGTPHGLAAGAGRVWVTVTGHPRAAGNGSAKALPESSCTEVLSAGGEEPRFLIASDLPLQGPARDATLPMVHAIELVLKRRDFRAGPYRIGYQSCDDSTAQTGNFDAGKCVANAKAYASNDAVLGVIGPYNSDCARAEIPILDRAPDGPLAMISPQNTSPSLTRRGPAGPRGEPGSLYPAGVRNYVRIVAPDDVQGAGAALFAAQLGWRKVVILHQRGDAYARDVAAGMVGAAATAGITVAGRRTWHPDGVGLSALAGAVARSKPDGVLLAGYLDGGGARLVLELRARLGKEAGLIAPDGFLPVPELLGTLGPAAEGMYLSAPGLTKDRLDTRGQEFLKMFAARYGPTRVPYAIASAAEAAEILVAAIGRSDGTRASVTRELRATVVKGGILGSLRFDRNGDATPSAVTIFRVEGQPVPNPTGVADFAGAVVERVIWVPTATGQE